MPRLRRVVISSLCIYLVVRFVCSTFLINRVAFYPEPGQPSWSSPLPQAVEEIYLEAQDKTRLQAFLIRSEGSPRVVLFLHGNAGNAYYRLPDALDLAQTGTNVFLLSYRGYGKSEGSPSESGVYQDGQAALDYLQDQLGFAEHQIFILGRSIGSAVAMEIAQHRGLAGLILVTPLSTGRDVGRASGLGWLLWLIGSPFDSLAKAPHVSCPALFIHGDADRVIPLPLGQKLFHALPTGAKTFHVVPGADHNNLIPIAGAQYWRWIRGFLNNPHAVPAANATHQAS